MKEATASSSGPYSKHFALLVVSVFGISSHTQAYNAKQRLAIAVFSCFRKALSDRTVLKKKSFCKGAK